MQYQTSSIFSAFGDVGLAFTGKCAAKHSEAAFLGDAVAGIAAGAVGGIPFS